MDEWEFRYDMMGINLDFISRFNKGNSPEKNSLRYFQAYPILNGLWWPVYREQTELQSKW